MDASLGTKNDAHTQICIQKYNVLYAIPVKNCSDGLSEAHCWISISRDPERDIPAVKALCEALDLSFMIMY